MKPASRHAAPHPAHVLIVFACLAVCACRPLSTRAVGATHAESARLDPEWTWTDERGLGVRFADLIGAPVVVAPIFASCTVRCPQTVEKVRRLDEAFRRRNVAPKILLVTLDPMHEDGPRLLRFKESRHLPESWRILRGSLEQTRTLGRMLGVRAIYDDTHIDHEVRIATFDARGRLVRIFEGWDFDDDEAASIALASTASAAPSEGPREAIALEQGGTAATTRRKLAIAYAGGTELRFDTLQRLIVDQNVQSVDGLVARLPAQLRSSYVLMRESRSLQGATARDPRAILYTHDAAFILTYNGDPNERGYNAIETIEFDSSLRSFRLREIAFPESASDARGVVFSEANPPRCLVCHGDDPRPIWDAYPEWPGAYGEVDHRPLGEVEAKGIASFLDTRKTNHRYGPLLDAEAFAARPLAADAAAYEGRERLSRNADFGAKLQRLAYRTIARRVAAALGFDSFRYALLAALDPQCPDIDAYLPDAVRLHFRRTARDFEHETDRGNAQEHVAKGERLAGGGRGDSVAVEALGPFRYIVEEGLRLSTLGWALALERDAHDFTTGRASIADLERELLEDVARGDSRLLPMRSAPERRDGYCVVLRRASLEALSPK